MAYKSEGKGLFWQTIGSGILPVILAMCLGYTSPVMARQAVEGKGGVAATSEGISGEASAQADIYSPSKEVEAITRDLLQRFQTNKTRYQKDQDAFVNEVDRLLSPVVAFDSIARGVMGKYAHRSEPAQIQQFEKVFKDSLIIFYGKALLKLDDAPVDILKVDDVPAKVMQEYQEGKIRQVPVNMAVKTSDRTLVISYSMIFDENRWKLRNIIIDGINIGIQFRKQFAEAVESHRKVQYVIDHWLDIMASNNAKGKKRSGG